MVKKVLALKEKNQIVDQKRIKSILANIKKILKNNIDPRITNKIWKNMIGLISILKEEILKK